MRQKEKFMSISPWKKMWFHPRKAIQSIVAISPNYGLKMLSFIYGIVSLSGLAQAFSLGSYVGFLPLILLLLIIAPFWGYLTFTFISWIVYQVGKWLKGRASYTEVRAVIAGPTFPS